MIIIINGISVFSNQNTPILKLNNQGHMGLIRNVVVTKDKSQIVTGSDDKTIKIWDTSNNAEVGQVLGQISEDSGEIYAFDISPDNRWLVSGGALERGRSVDFNYIRVYDFQTKTLKKLLISHNDTVKSLFFSKDGKYLVSSSMDNSIIVWDVSLNFSLYKTIKIHKKEVNAVKIFKIKNRYYTVSASSDKNIILYSLDDNRIVNSYQNKTALNFLSINEDLIICSSHEDNNLLVFDINLNIIKKITLDSIPCGLAISDDGKYILTGSSSEYDNELNYILSVKEDFKIKTVFKKHNNTSMAVAFLDNNTALTCGSDNNEIYIWDIFSGRVKNHIKGKGRTFYSCFIDNDRVFLSDNYDSDVAGEYFDLRNFNLKKYNASEKIKSMPVRYKDFVLQLDEEDESLLYIKKSGRVVANITKGSRNGYRHTYYGFLENGLIISGGDNGHIKVYDREANEICSLVGHIGTVLNIYSNNEVVLTTSDDQMIKFWNLNDITEQKKISPYMSLFISIDREWVLWNDSGYYNSSINGDKYIGYHINQGKEREALFYSSDRFCKQYYKPEIIKNLIKTKKIESITSDAPDEFNDQSISNILPPQIIMIYPNEQRSKIDENEIVLEYEIVNSADLDFEEPTILINGKKVITKERALKLKGKKNIIKKNIFLNEKSNKITIIPRTKYSVGNPISFIVDLNDSKVKITDKPNIFLLSIGVSDYKNPDYNLRFADIDASSITELFKNYSNTLFNSCEYRLLLNKEATKENIIKSLEWLVNSSSYNDLAIVFIAGHGANDNKNNYHFICYDSDINDLSGTALNWGYFSSSIVNIQSKTIILADTCHSGNILGDRNDIISAIKLLKSEEMGKIIMAASDGNSVSYENEIWGHGAFTKSIIDGVKHKKADFTNNGNITFRELDMFVNENVKELTENQQIPKTIIPDFIVPDFLISEN